MLRLTPLLLALLLAPISLSHQLTARQSLAISTDNTCGALAGFRCPGDSCCSYTNFCGDTRDYCGSGCQREFGKCNADAGAKKVTECGPSNNNQKCGDGECCSPTGSCGIGPAYCRSPDCLLGFGKCDASITPSGLRTFESIPKRPHVGDVPYGVGIFNCKNPGEIALTYDDGPYKYTNALLDLLEANDAKATFFMTGVSIGKGAIDDPQFGWDKVVKRMYTSGHQLASHTWSHADLNAITPEQRKDEMEKLEMAFRNIAGVVPTYMRPPYSECNDECMKDMSDWGYHVVYFDLDTDDYALTKPEKLPEAIKNVDDILKDADSKKDGFLAIAHDIHEQSATKLTEYMLKMMKEKGYKGVTVGECLGDPEENWYRGGKYGAGGEGGSAKKDQGKQSSTSQKATSKSEAAAKETVSLDATSTSSSAAKETGSLDATSISSSTTAPSSSPTTVDSESKKSASTESEKDFSDAEASVSDKETTSEEAAKGESSASRTMSKFGVAGFTGLLVLAAFI